MEKYWLYLLLACLVVLFIISLIGLANNPQIKPHIEKFVLNVLKPFLKKSIKQLMINVEFEMAENEKAGVEKMTKVVLEVSKKLPPVIRNYVTAESVQVLCQSVYDKLQDVIQGINKHE